MSTGISLGLASSTLDQIKMDYNRSVQETIKRMLMRWRDDLLHKKPWLSPEDMKDCLVNALREHEGFLAEQVEKLGIQDTYPDSRFAVGAAFNPNNLERTKEAKKREIEKRSDKKCAIA